MDCRVMSAISMAQVAPDEISAIEDVDVIIGTKNRARIVELCEESKKSNLKFNIVSELTKDCGFDVLSLENPRHFLLEIQQ